MDYLYSLAHSAGDIVKEEIAPKGGNKLQQNTPFEIGIAVPCNQSFIMSKRSKHWLVAYLDVLFGMMQARRGAARGVQGAEEGAYKGFKGIQGVPGGSKGLQNVPNQRVIVLKEVPNLTWGMP